MLGTGWPLPPYTWPLDFGIDEEADSQAEETDEGRLYDLSFFLLTPDFVFEQLDLSVVLPQALWEVIDLVQTCRQAERAAYFPCLVPVVPQPDPGWGILLAVPEWPSSQVVVCCDLSFYDGRIIAVCAPIRVDTHLLCELVGLASFAEVDIYLTYATHPLERGAECDLATGNLVTFLRPGSRRHAVFDIHAMLSTHLGWEHSPVFPRDRQGNGYCVVSTGGQILYRCRQDRLSFYRADIALLAGLSPTHIELTPATPCPDDVCVHGWTCRAVIVARSDERRRSGSAEVEALIVGLLDCRPLLGGWLYVTTRDGWLDLTPIRDMLQLRAPSGWCVIFPQLPSHWTWTCLTSGQIIAVLLAIAAPGATGVMENPHSPDSPTGSASGLDQSRLFAHPLAPPPYEDPDRNSSPFRREVVPRTRLCDKGRWPATWYYVCLLLLLLCLVGASWDGLSLALLGSAIKNKGGLALYLGISATLLRQDGIAAGMHTLPLQSSSVKAISGTRAPADLVPPRPVATPCRSHWYDDREKVVLHSGLHDLAHETGLGLDSLRLVTLLEESAGRSWDWAFLASTLLDTLIEHFQETSRSDTQMPTSVRLQLADHLPSARTFDLTALSVDFGRHFQTAFGLAAPGSWIIPAHLPSRQLQAEAAQLGFGSTDLVLPVSGPLHVYTDGSFDGSCSSWAFVVVSPAAQQQQIFGWAGGQVITAQDHPHYIGAERHSPVAGEQCALAWAIIWALQAPQWVEPLFFSDCEADHGPLRFSGGANPGCDMPAPLPSPIGSSARLRAYYQPCQESHRPASQ